MSTTEVVRIPQQQQQAEASLEEEQGRLKTDLHYLKKRGLLKAPTELSYQGRKCARCCAPFGRFYNTGTSCSRCRHRICRQCRLEIKTSNNSKETGWICNVCYKIAELHVITGKWIYENSFHGEIATESKSSVDILKHSIRRAWTINGPPTCWSAARKSPELRIYRSLPTRRQEYRESIENNDSLIEVDKGCVRSLRFDETHPSGCGNESSVNDSRCFNESRERERKINDSSFDEERSASQFDVHDRTKRRENWGKKEEEDTSTVDSAKSKKEKICGTVGRAKSDGQEESNQSHEQSSLRISLLKPPRILAKLISPEIKLSQIKHGERKSNIPVFRRSSKEFEDIRNPQESHKRSLIPQRYRGSTDDLRRSREDINAPSLIPKLLSPRNKEERLKHQDSKDDVRCASKSNSNTRKIEGKEETKGAVVQSNAKEDTKIGVRIFRRDNRDDVGRESTTNSNVNTSVASKGKQTGKEEKQEKTEERVGEVTTSKSKSIACEQGKRKLSSRECKETGEDGSAAKSGEDNFALVTADCGQLREGERVEVDVRARQFTMLDVIERSVSQNQKNETLEEKGKERNEKAAFDDGGGDDDDDDDDDEEEGGEEKEKEKRIVIDEELELKGVKEADLSMKQDTESLSNNSDRDVSAFGVNDRKSSNIGHGKKVEEFQVVRRKFSKDEFSNPDDTDDTPNKRCSSHLSPEVSPLSTRSSKYSPRESESEPTPALPRKIGGDSCSASQRIREAITRSRRESNSSTRYESSGSESVRLSETGLHGYTELARKVKLFGGSGSNAVPLTVGNDEVMQRDSATSAGEDEPHDDAHGRIATLSSQGRSMFRRRRQFDAQGSRRRGRSHARTCCGEELQSLQTLHVIGRSDRQQSPTGNQGQDQPIVDYRRLVFISSDSSSGREEDDADSSCSSSSYLNGLPRGSGHAQSLEDCDWDYFESGSLPLPHGVPVAIGTNNAATDVNVAQDWSCCPGRGSSACQACGGSRGANVLPVPVPIPVPVPYPVPVPASLWTGDFAAAASSMISRGADAHVEAGTLRLRGDPAAPWFAWHPRFNQPLHRGRLDPRLTGVFDPTTCTFKPDQVIAPRLYESVVGASISTTESLQHRLETPRSSGRDESDDVRSRAIPKVNDVPEKENVPVAKLESTASGQNFGKITEKIDERKTDKVESSGKLDDIGAQGSEEIACEDSLSSSFESRDQMIYQRSQEDSGSSSGRSSADSSDLEEDSSSHRFSRVFVVNDDSLTSDNDIEDNAEEDDSDCATEGGVTLKRIIALPEEEPVILQHIRLLNEDGDFDYVNFDKSEQNAMNKDAPKNMSPASESLSGVSGNRAVEKSSMSLSKRKLHGRKGSLETDNNDEVPLLLNHRIIPEEMYVADDSEFSDNRIELKSVRTLDPDSIELSSSNSRVSSFENSSSTKMDTVAAFKTAEKDFSNSLLVEKELEERNEMPHISGTNTIDDDKSSSLMEIWDSSVIPDSLEISEQIVLDSNNVNFEDFEIAVNAHQRVSTPSCDEGIVDLVVTRDNGSCEIHTDKDETLSKAVDEESVDHKKDTCDNSPQHDFNSNQHTATNSSVPSATDSSTSNETTIGSEVSSDELHEYEVTSLEQRTVFSTVQRNAECKRTLENIKSKEENKNSNASIVEGESISEPKKPNNGKVESVLNAKIIDNSIVFATDNEYSSPKNHRAAKKDNNKEESLSTGERDGKTKSLEQVGGTICSRIQEIFMNEECNSKADSAHDSSSFAVRGESPASDQVVGGTCGSGSDEGGTGVCSNSSGRAEEGGTVEETTEEEGATRFRSVERRPSSRKENGFPLALSSKDYSSKDAQHFASTVTSNGNSISNNSNNKYRSLVMITQETSYQAVSVITSDTTTLLQPDEVHSTTQGLAGYFQLALEATTEQPHRKNGQGPRKPLMVKRLTTNAAIHSEGEVDSGLSVGSASESDDVSIKNASKINNRQENSEDSVPKERQNNDHRDGSRARASSQSSDDNSGSGGVVILEEGLADDDSWVEEVSHDEDEPGATTATEESSEDEANNLGDREEELRGYHRQAIDFTLHTIVEESCEESEAEPSLTAGSPSKKQRPPSASELEKYFFFGLCDGNNSSMGSREVDSLSETSSIYSEGLESLGQDEPSNSSQNQDRSGSGEGFLNSSRLEKYFLSEFLGFDQDRRDSDGSVGSDSEGRPSPEAQRRKRLVRARGTGRSHSSSLDNLLALTQSSQNLSSQNSLQDLSLNQDMQETQSEGSSTETDGAEDGQTPVFGTDGQFDTVKRKKKKPRNLGTQSPRVSSDDRNKTPEPNREMVLVGEVVVEDDTETVNSDDSERAKTPQPEGTLSPFAFSPIVTNTSSISSSQTDSTRNVLSNSADSIAYNQRSKQQSRDSGFVGSCDDLLQHQKVPDDVQIGFEGNQDGTKKRLRKETSTNSQKANESTTETVVEKEKINSVKTDHPVNPTTLPHLPNASLSRKDSFNNWSSDEETNLMMSKMRQFFKTMVANSNGQGQNTTNTNSTGASPAPSPRLPGYTSKTRMCPQNRTKPPQLVYFENELTRLMKTVPGIRDEQVREIVEYLSSEDTWSDSYDSSDYTSSDLEGAAGGRRSALQEQISQSCQQIISKFDTTSGDNLLTDKDKEEKVGSAMQAPCIGRDTAFVYQKLVQSFTKMTGDGVSSDANSTPHSSPPLIAKVMHHIGSRLVALMHEVSEGGPAIQHHSTSSWRRYSQHHRTPSSASTTEDDDSTSDSTNTPSSAHLQLPRSKSHDPLLLINNHPTTSTGQEGEERETSDYERFSWRGSFESALMAADSRTKLSLLACSGDVSGGNSASASALAMAAKRRSAGDLLFNPRSLSREQLDRVRSCGSIGGSAGGISGCGGSVEERIWSNRRRSSVPDANTRGESGASAGDEDTEDELEYGGESRATTLPRGVQSALTAATNSLPRLPASTAPTGLTTTSTTPSTMHKAHSVYHFLPQHSGVKSARYRPPGFARNSNVAGAIGGPKRAVSAPGLQVSGSQTSAGKRDNSRSRRQQAMSLTPDDGSSLSEACSTPIIGTGSRAGSSHTVMDMDDMDSGLHSSHSATRASLSSLGARSDSMASVYSGAGEGRCCRSVVVTGEVEFALQYDYKHLTFEVHVTKCKNLAPVDVKRKRSDPYVKVYLLPDKSKSGKRKTKVKKHTLNPEFNETLKFHMSLSGLETRTLWLTVWHSDMFGRNDFLGEVRMPLENKIFDDPTPRWYPLQERTEPFDDPVAYKGEVIVGLKFVPPDPQQQEREMGSDHKGASKSRKNWSRGSLHVLIKEARNLQTRSKNGSGTCDPFCKSYLLPDKGRSGKQKTGVVRRSGGSPVWGHTFIYKDVSLQELAERGLELTVWDHDRIASNEFLGGVRFNLGTGKHYGKPVDWMDATGRELSLWQSMLERPNFWVEGAVTLRPNLHNHGKNNGS